MPGIDFTTKPTPTPIPQPAAPSVQSAQYDDSHIQNLFNPQNNAGVPAVNFGAVFNTPPVELPLKQAEQPAALDPHNAAEAVSAAVTLDPQAPLAEAPVTETLDTAKAREEVLAFIRGTKTPSDDLNSVTRDQLLIAVKAKKAT